MRFETTVGENGEIVIPVEVRDKLELKPESAVWVQVTALAGEPKNREPDWATIDEIVARLGGPMRAALIADGYATFDDYIDDIRGR